MTKKRKWLTHRINLYFKKEVEDLEAEKDEYTNTHEENNKPNYYRDSYSSTQVHMSG